MYNFDADFEVFKQELLANEPASALEGIMKKVQQVAAGTHIVPISKPSVIRNKRKGQSTKKGCGVIEKRDPIAAEIVNEEMGVAQKQCKAVKPIPSTSACRQKRPCKAKEDVSDYYED